MNTILAADLGGTKTILSLSITDGQTVVERREQVFVSADYHHFKDMLETFLKGQPVDAACLAVAGPVSGETATITNLPWKLDSGDIARSLNIKSVQLLNDFHAIGYGVDALTDENVITLQQGEPVDHANRAVIGAGTGLGQAFMTYHQGAYQVHACEGGHADFAPNNEQEIELLQFLQSKYGHVSYERLLSGMGLKNIYDFLKQRFPEDIDEEFDQTLGGDVDAPAKISQQGLKTPAHITSKALEYFVTIYGAQAGNLVLNYNCAGGVYIAGGIAAKILPVMNSDTFRQAFNDKGRMSKLTQKTPVYLITEPRVGLLGAENLAIRSIT